MILRVQVFSPKLQYFFLRNTKFISFMYVSKLKKKFIFGCIHTHYAHIVFFFSHILKYTLFFFLVKKKRVKGATSVVSLFGRDYNSTLPTPRRVSILLVYEKLTYYSLDRLR